MFIMLRFKTLFYASLKMNRILMIADYLIFGFKAQLLD